MSKRKQQTVRHGKGKHRTVGQSEEEPWFQKKRNRSRTSAKIAKQSRRFNRNK